MRIRGRSGCGRASSSCGIPGKSLIYLGIKRIYVFSIFKKSLPVLCCNFQIHKSFQAMEKANFGALLTNLVDEIPLFVSESDEQDIEEKEGK